MLKSLSSFVLFVLSLLMLVGCGGGGGGGGNPTVAPVRFSVDWAARSREFTAPGSALSGTLKLSSGTPAQTALTYTFDRQADPAAYTATYTTPGVRTGRYTLAARFYAQAGGTGDVVGSADVAVRVLSNGTLATATGAPLGNIATVGRVASVTVVTDQNVPVGTTQDLAFTARDAQGNVLALSPGSATFSVTAGSDRLQVTPGGAATALSAGSATVQVSVDGVTATGIVLAVGPPSPSVRTIDLSVRTLVYDKTRNLLYGSVAGSATQNPNSVVAIDPATGAVTKAVFVGSEPNRLAIADDDSTLYVTLDGPGAVRRIDLATFVAGLQFSLSSGSPLFAEDIAVRPGHPNTVAVARYTRGVSPRQSGVGLFVDGVLRPNLTGGNVIAFDETGNVLFSHTNETTDFGVGKSSVDDDGLVTTQSQGGLVGSFGRDISYARGRLFTTEFKEINGSDLTLLGEFPNRNFDAVVTPDPTNDYVYTLTWDGVVRHFQIFRATDFARVFTLDTPPLGGGIPSLVKIDASTFAFNTTENQIHIVEHVSTP